MTAGIAGAVAPTAPENTEQAKHWSHVDGAGAESGLRDSCSVACPSACNAAACWPMTSASASQKAEAMRRMRIMDDGRAFSEAPAYTSERRPAGSELHAVHGLVHGNLHEGIELRVLRQVPRRARTHEHLALAAVL